MYIINTDNTTNTTTIILSLQYLDVAHDVLHEEHVTQHLLTTRQSGIYTLYNYWDLHYSLCIYFCIYC